jgi:hypothetical protein
MEMKEKYGNDNCMKIIILLNPICLLHTTHETVEEKERRGDSGEKVNIIRPLSP